MSHSMAWVTMKLPQSGGAGTGCDVADSMRVPSYAYGLMYIEYDICQITHNHLLLNAKLHSKQNQIETKTTNSEKNVTSTGMISIEIYGPRDLFILLARLLSTCFLCVDFIPFQMLYVWFYLNLFII